jgi:hypothetical protein
MAYTKPTQITVSGNVIDKNNFFHSANSGDIELYRKDDREGASARREGHTNYRYSGYYLAKIFDGKDWRNLKINALVPYKDRSYERATDCPNVVDYLKTIISSWRGSIAVYDSDARSFRIHHLERPDLL